MAEKCTWIDFRAHPSGFIPDEDFHPDFFGTFVCPASRTRPEELLVEVLGNRKLALIEIGGTHSKSKSEEWGMYERLKAVVDEQGFGISLMKVVAKPDTGD